MGELNKITKIEVNKVTSDRLFRTISTQNTEESKKNYSYVKSFTGVPIIANEELNNGEIKIFYNDISKTISSIDFLCSLNRETSFEMEYESEWSGEYKGLTK